MSPTTTDLTPTVGRVEQRRARTRQEILEAAWATADRDGIAGMSLKDVADRVGMRTPSLWNYFEGRGALLDAMFEQGYRQMHEAMRSVGGPGDRTARLVELMDGFVGFCQASIGRYQLLFTRAVPDWEPTPEAYAASQEIYGELAGALADLGITEPDDLDLFTAIVSGLAAQQLANDPSGDRWRRLVGRAGRMFLDHLDHSDDERQTT